MKRSLFLAALVGLTPLAPLDAQEAQCPLSYETFEISVPHTDMETCPETLAGEGLFCRLSLVPEVATVFVFSEETDCLISSRAFYDDEFTFAIE